MTKGIAVGNDSRKTKIFEKINVNSLISDIIDHDREASPSEWSSLINEISPSKNGNGDYNTGIFGGRITHNTISTWKYQEKSPSLWRQKAIVIEMLRVKNGGESVFESDECLKKDWDLFVDSISDVNIRLRMIGVSYEVASKWTNKEGKCYPPFWSIRYLINTIPGISNKCKMDISVEKHHSKLNVDEIKEKILRNKDKFDEREYDILSMYYGVNLDKMYSLGIIAKKYNVSRQRIDAIRIKSIEKVNINHDNKKSLVKNNFHEISC